VGSKALQENPLWPLFCVNLL